VVLPDEYFSYELKGVVIHTGSADSGHYYSFIQKRGGRNEGWFEFNDTVVKKFDPENLAG
jgi:ubiquitin carboxyl-terminal hydrolase 9/24